MREYTDKVRDHFISPKHLGSLPDADGVGEVGNRICGDTVRMHVKLNDGAVEKVKWQSFGCMFSVACADELAGMAEGKQASAVEKIEPADVVQSLGGVPDSKRHCSVMAVNALRAALKNAGEQVELLSGSRELTDSSVKVPIALQKKHLVAELFDEFIVPELGAKNIDVELLSVDVDLYEVRMTASSSKQYAKEFVEKLLKKHVSEGIEVIVV